MPIWRSALLSAKGPRRNRLGWALLAVCLACSQRDGGGHNAPRPSASILLADPLVETDRAEAPPLVALPDFTDDRCTGVECPSNPRVATLLQQGRRYLRIGNIGRARLSFEAAHEMAPENVECSLAYAEIGMEFLRPGLRPILEAAARRRSDDSRVWLLRGLLEIREDRPKDSFQYLEQAAILAPSDPEIQVGMAEASLAAGDLLRAEGIWRAILAQRQLRPRWRYLYGKFLLASGRREQAKRELEVAARPRNLEPDGVQFVWTLVAAQLLHEEFGYPKPAIRAR